MAHLSDLKPGDLFKLKDKEYEFVASSRRLLPGTTQESTIFTIKILHSNALIEVAKNYAVIRMGRPWW